MSFIALIFNSRSSKDIEVDIYKPGQASDSQLKQGPRSNFEMAGGGGGTPLVTRYWGGRKTPFLTNSL